MNVGGKSAQNADREELFKRFKRRGRQRLAARAQQATGRTGRRPSAQLPMPPKQRSAAAAAAPHEPQPQPPPAEQPSPARTRRYASAVAHPAAAALAPAAVAAGAAAELEYDPFSGEQRASQLQGLHTGALHELSAATYLHALGVCGSVPRSVPSYEGDELVLSQADGGPSARALRWLLGDQRAAVATPSLDAGTAAPAVVPGESVQLQPARGLLLAVIRSLAFCHERGLTSREARPTALFYYGRGTQPWDTELDELFECRKHRTAFSEGTAFDEVWIDYLPPEILLGPEAAVTPRRGAARAEPEKLDVAAADMWAVGCWFAEILRGGKTTPSSVDSNLPTLRFKFANARSAVADRA